jgi:hypothetical protein
MLLPSRDGAHTTHVELQTVQYDFNIFRHESLNQVRAALPSGNIMPDDKQFDKSEFENVIRKLLTTKPLPKKDVKSNKHRPLKTVLPPHPPKPEK